MNAPRTILPPPRMLLLLLDGMIIVVDFCGKLTVTL
jgi:hypothetical protein